MTFSERQNYRKHTLVVARVRNGRGCDCKGKAQGTSGTDGSVVYYGSGYTQIYTILTLMNCTSKISI